MQTIHTKILAATDTLDCRVKVRCARATRTYPRPDEYDGEVLHRWAVAKMLEEFATDDTPEGGVVADHHWGPFVSGGNEDGSYTHVLIGRGNGVARADLRDAAQKALEFIHGPRNSVDAEAVCDALRKALA